MSVEGIIEKIISEAKAEADKIINEAKGEAGRIDQELKKEAEKYYEEQKKQLENRYKSEKERAILNKRLDNRKELLGVRQKWMDDAFSTAYKRLVDQPFKEYENLMIKLIRGVSSISKDEEIVFGKKGTDSEVKALLDRLNKEMGGNYKIAKERGKFEWGFVLKKGKIETNVTIDSLFRYKRDELEQKAWEIFNAAE